MSKEEIIRMALEAGAVAIGFAPAGEVAPDVTAHYRDFLRQENDGTPGPGDIMPYLNNYQDIRSNPLKLFEPEATSGTVISMAFPYWHPSQNKLFARYAQGADYHKILRKRLKPMAREISATTGARTRICVDTAPIFERYWAVKAGVGFIGRNGCLIVPGAGSWVFLAEIVTEAVFEPDAPCVESCRGCNGCIRHCPGKALTSSGLRAARCHSCLTIEHRGKLPDDTQLLIPYGCDRCQTVCPHNVAPPHGLPEFAPSEKILNMDIQTLTSLTEEEYAALTANSAISRCSLPQLKRNLQSVMRRNAFPPE